MSDDYEKNFWDGFFFGTLLQSPFFWGIVAIIGGFMLFDAVMSNISTVLPYILAALLCIVSIICVFFELVSIGSIYRIGNRFIFVCILVVQIFIVLVVLKTCFYSPFVGNKSLLMFVATIVNSVIAIFAKLYISRQMFAYAKTMFYIVAIIGVIYLIFSLILCFNSLNSSPHSYSFLQSDMNYTYIAED